MSINWSKYHRNSWIERYLAGTSQYSPSYSQPNTFTINQMLYYTLHFVLVTNNENISGDSTTHNSTSSYYIKRWVALWLVDYFQLLHSFVVLFWFFFMRKKKLIGLISESVCIIFQLQLRHLIMSSTNVKIVGSVEELGMWDVRKAPNLQRHKDGWWRVSLFISDAKFPFQYPPHRIEDIHHRSQIFSNILSFDLDYFYLYITI